MGFIKKICAAAVTVAIVASMAMPVYADSVTVTNSYANCRQNPGAANKYLGRVYAGQTYELLGTGKAQNGKLWYKIDKGGAQMWICSSFARINKDAANDQSEAERLKLSEADRRYIASVVSAESRGEPYRGQVAVAQVIYDRAVKNKMTPRQVVDDPGQFAKAWGGGKKFTDSCYKAVCAVFDRGERAISGTVYNFCTLNCYPSWAAKKEYVTSIGNHKFYR